MKNRVFYSILVISSVVLLIACSARSIQKGDLLNTGGSPTFRYDKRSVPDNLSQPIVPNSNTTKCDKNYSGGCVPIAADVDCLGGSGNGPKFVRGPVYVVGYDTYGLDRDKDGIGCE